MVKIAIYDYIGKNYTQIEQFIKNYASANHIVVSIDIYINIQHLLKTISLDRTYELIIIVEDPNSKNIVSIGQQVKTIYAEQFIGIIFVINNYKNIFELSMLQPLGILQNPTSKDKIYELLDTYIDLSNRPKTFFKVKNNNRIKLIPYKDIIYITSLARRLAIFTYYQKYMCYGTINKIKEIIGFIKPHNSYLINVNHIKEYNYTNIKMVNGDDIPVSQSHRKEIKEIIEKLI